MATRPSNEDEYNSQLNPANQQPNDDGTFEEDESVEIRDHEDLAESPPKQAHSGRNLLVMLGTFVILFVILALFFGTSLLSCDNEVRPSDTFESPRSPQTPGNGPPVGLQ